MQWKLAAKTFAWLAGIVLAMVGSVSAQTVLPLPSGTSTNGMVRAIATQADGKVVIGGYFSTINGIPRGSLARLNVDGSLDETWTPAVDGLVHDIAISANTVYVAGEFTHVNSGGLHSTRNRIAAIDAISGMATSWNPNANGTVRAVTVSGHIAYLAGDFTEVGYQPRNYIAAVDTETNFATSWNANANRPVHDIAVGSYLSGSYEIVFAVGDFFMIGGMYRQYVAALNNTTGAATPWTADADNFATTIALSGSHVYVGGAFHVIKGQPRERLAALTAPFADPNAGSSLASWNPGADGDVWSVAWDHDAYRLLVAGDFTHVGGEERPHVAELRSPNHPDPGHATDWHPNLGQASINRIAPFNGQVFLGGNYIRYGSPDEQWGIVAVTATESIFRNGFDGVGR